MRRGCAYGYVVYARYVGVQGRAIRNSETCSCLPPPPPPPAWFPFLKARPGFGHRKGRARNHTRSSGVAALHCADRLARLRCPWSLRLGLEPEFLGSVGSCVVVASRQGGKAVSTCLDMS